VPSSVIRRPDGSIALYIDNDLQFDSADERIYHEALVIPALAIAQRRKSGPISALIIGGGDGLTARQLCKSRDVAHIDLVDYDPEIIRLGQTEFSTLNENSLSDARMSMHVKDAWEFVDGALAQGRVFDLIVSDLTVANDAQSARFHSTDWYEKLKRLAGDTGIISVNAVSPHAAPEAFWSIFNGMLYSGLHAKPLRVFIPSFAALGYGPDWGFILASAQSIVESDLDDSTILPDHTHTLKDAIDLRNLFLIPERLFIHQTSALPARAGSTILLHYFHNNTNLVPEEDQQVNCLARHFSSLIIPEPDATSNLLSPELSAALAKCIQQEHGIGAGTESGFDLTSSVLQLMPSLGQYQTPELIADFVSEPARFLHTIDIPGLVALLLRRAAELPSHLVAELELLHQNLVDWAGDYESIVKLGHRAITILTLVVVVGNLVFPDAVYGKGGHAGHAAYHGGDRGHDRGERSYGNRGRGYGGYRGYWGHHWGTWGWSRPWHSYYWGGGYVPPVYYGTNNWTTVSPGPNEYTDETGSAYPVRSYTCSSALVQNYGTISPAKVAAAQSSHPLNLRAAYRLSDGADVLPNGRVVVPLSEQSYLLVGPHNTHVIDQATGANIATIATDPALLYQTDTEIRRQAHRLTNELKEQTGSSSQAIPAAVANSDNSTPATTTRLKAHVDRLHTALQIIGPVPQPVKGGSPPLIPGGVEAFAGTWMTPDGKYLAMKRPDGRIAYMDGHAWYSDKGKTKLTEPYPTKLKNVATTFLSKMVRDSDSTKNMLLQDKNEGQSHLDMLNRELNDYQTATGQPDDSVAYGSRQMPRSEAIRLTDLAIKRTTNKLNELQTNLDALPNETSVAQKMLTTFGAPIPSQG